ncbi:MAG: ABC transporter ATP-binding protein [Lachnospiraceae bacterium]|nr:ABC transporter ATP-binding protein [Candidatus Equihabitans merdae]
MIAAKNLRKDYSGFSLNVDFEIPSGRITGLVGKNGAGKSTTIKLILGLIKPDEGDITVMGIKAGELDAKDKEQMGVALAESGFSPYLTVNAVVSILKKCYHTFDEGKFREACRRMHLPMNKQLKEFSTGMKAKLRVLVALSHDARLLIMDEPTAGLDVEARVEVLDMIRDYMVEDESRTVLITSHISSDLESICDDIYLINNGQVILHEDTDVILGQCGVLKVDAQTYQTLDKNYLVKSVKTPYGYACFTKEKRYYQDNYPGMVIENGSIDELILMLTGGAER